MPIKQKKLSTWWSWVCSPKTYRSLRINNVNFCDTALLVYHQPISRSYMSWFGHKPCDHLAFKNASLKTHWGTWAFFWTLVAPGSLSSTLQFKFGSVAFSVISQDYSCFHKECLSGSLSVAFCLVDSLTLQNEGFWALVPFWHLPLNAFICVLWWMEWYSKNLHLKEIVKAFHI